MRRAERDDALAGLWVEGLMARPRWLERTGELLGRSRPVDASPVRLLIAAPSSSHDPGAGTRLTGRVPVDARASFRSGVLAGLPFGAAALLLGLSFGVLAVDAGFPPVAAIVMSAIANAGSCQFAALAVVTGGGSLPTAVVAGTLMNGRYVPMGLAFGPSLRGGPLRRAIGGQGVVDASWVISNLGEGRFDRFKLWGATVPQWCAWTGGTAIGALAQGSLGDLDRFGVDAVYPAFFASLLVLELRAGRGRLVALAGGAVALGLSPFTPAGVPVLAASLVALLGLRMQPPARAEAEAS